jgi:glycosyltransferase involved in cell wall biosynthesis
MRIFTLDRHPSSRNGGQEWSLLDECVGLVGRGHDVTLGYVTDGDLLARHRAAGVRTVQLTGVELAPARRLSSAADFVRSAIRSAASADVVSINQYHDALFGRAVATRRRRPLVCHLRLTPPDMLCTQWRIGLGGVSRFIAVSHAVRRQWIDQIGLPEDGVDVVHDGIDVDRFRPVADRIAVRRALGTPDEAFVAVYAGRIDASKNIEGMLRAFAALGMRGANARLWIAGRPVAHATPEDGARYVESLRDLAKALGIHDQVDWLGTRDDIPALLASADVALLFAYNEAFGRATVEALACGTPIVAHRPSGTSEILTGEFARFAFDLDKPDETVAVIRSCIGLRQRDPGFPARARAHVVANFATSAMVGGVERSLARLLENRLTARSLAKA